MLNWRDYYFRWFQLEFGNKTDFSAARQSDIFFFFFLHRSASSEKGKRASCCQGSSRRWLRTIFPCCTSLLCDTFKPLQLHQRPQFNILCTTDFIRSPGQVENADWCTSTYAQSTWTDFYHQLASFVMIFPTVANHTEHPQTHQEINRSIHEHIAETRTVCIKRQTHVIQSPFFMAVGGWGKSTWMEQLLVLWQHTQSQLISLTGYLKGSDSILAVTGVAWGDGDIPAAALCTLWTHGED